MSIKKSLVLFLLLFLTLPQLVWAEGAQQIETPAAELLNTRFAVSQDAGGDKLRVVLETTCPVQAAASSGTGLSSQITVTLNGAAPGKQAGNLALDGDIASDMTISSIDKAASQVAIHLPMEITEADYSVFTLPQDEKSGKPYRVVIDIRKPVFPPDIQFTPGLRGKVIALDPGHGGSDSGAVGPNQVQEKAVTLAVSLRVKKLLENAGAVVYMTREDDVDVYAPNDTATEELSARADVGNANHVDIFVDIHANSFGDPSVGGTGTYYYRKTSYDSLLAQSLQTGLVRADGLTNRGIYAANFYVLKHTDMPAALIELAFLSNPNEESLLNSPQYQQKLAQGIVNGLNVFFSRAAQIGGKK
ncbi:MAG: N-acetylmuramoyl-L-alanine amidase [Pelosinus sp.]|nr:N-acetylmuramoyl-L-alanine amidase [Pelosinus sp.]